MTRTNTIGVIVPRLDGHFISSALKGIVNTTAEQGYEVIITHSEESRDKEIASARLLYDRRVDGLICSLAAETSDLTHFDAFSEKGVPVVFFDRVEQMHCSDTVGIDNFRCGFLATEHLINQGCRRIAIVTAGLERNVYAQRYLGYKQALNKYAVPFSDELLILEDIDVNSGVEAAERILQLDPLPDGLFITSDLVAAMCMHVLQEAGIRVPGDIAIVGFNNDPLGRLITPTLTTIDYPGLEVGKTAAASLLDQLSGRGALLGSTTAILPSKLIVRNSSLRSSQRFFSRTICG
jgi:LacI family transcriptional regulator